jgi:hypothetical protein
MSRREALATAALLVGGATLPRWGISGDATETTLAAGPSPDPLSGVSLYDDVLRFTGMGEHRCGSEADLRTSAWIRDELELAGLEVEVQRFPVRVFDIRSCTVTCEGVVYRGHPEWYPTATGPNPARGPLATLEDGAPLDNLRGKIWLTETDTSDGLLAAEELSDELKRRIDAAGRAGALAAVVIVHHRSFELAGRNNHDPAQNQAPWCSIPIVAVAATHREPLLAAVRHGAEAEVVVDGVDRRDGQACNVIGRTGTGEKLICISTPSSCHFRGGGERAPGVVLLLGLARWLGRRQPGARYLVLADSGHEIGGLGLTHFDSTHLPPPENVTCWVHLGSGCGVWRWQKEGIGLEPRPTGLRATAPRGGVGLFYSAAEFHEVLGRAFAHIPALEPQSERPAGVFDRLAAKGYRGFSFSGGNMFTHTVADGPEQTAPELLEPLALGIARALEAIEGP